MENQNRSAPPRRVGVNQLVKFEGNRKENTPKGKLTPLWNRGRCPASNLLRMPFACVGLDWARPSSSSTLIALIKLLLRLRSHARIGVGAAGNKTNEQTGRGSAPEKTSTSTNKPYDLTSHLHPRPPYLTSYIGVRPFDARTPKKLAARTS